MDNLALWQLSATEINQRVSVREVRAVEVTQSVLDHIARTNPHFNALTEVSHNSALAEARAIDARLARGDTVGPLSGVPVTIKVNVDVAGSATTEGLVSLKNAIAQEDSPVVTSLRDAGAVIVGRTNTPAFSLRWFTDNDAHGRTLNPFDPTVTPGGSSGGAAVATATGMGAIAHGNDYGGSVRYPAWACGVVGLRTTVGRIPSYKRSGLNRTLTNQQMSVQGPLTRSVADARLALSVMARGSPYDPQWVDAPLGVSRQPGPLKVAVFAKASGYDVDPSQTQATLQAARWLEAAGHEIVEVEPPHFEECCLLWRDSVFNDIRRAMPTLSALGDRAVQISLQNYLQGVPVWSADDVLEAMQRRFTLARAWSVFFSEYPVLLMPNSFARQFPIDADVQNPEVSLPVARAQAPLLATAMLGLPGLSVPIGLDRGLPTGVQIVTSKFQEDLALEMGEIIEARAGFDALTALMREGKVG